MSVNKDSLGDRMKEQYENRARFMLPRRTYTIIRCDGKAFHTLTRRCEKPYDLFLVDAMQSAMVALCVQAQGAQFGYVQSDEISVLLTDFSDIKTDAWFDGNLQKIVSVAASIVTQAFNRAWVGPASGAPAFFDARVFTIADPTEVENYFIWRQQDATRNSIQGLSQAHFSARRLHGVNMAQAQELLFTEKGINWNNLPTPQKRGVCAVREATAPGERGCTWIIDQGIPVFTAERDYLTSRIPRL